MRLLLCGGGFGNKTKIANKKLNEIINHNKPLLYVPLAMDEKEHPYDDCLEWVKGELSDVDVPSVEMVKSFNDLANKNYEDYCAIFIGGGNTYKLLKGIKESGAYKKIENYINNDGIVYGSSAGAIIFGYDIDSCLAMDDNEVKLKDTKGFNALKGKSIFAHYTNEYTKETHEDYKKYLIKYSLSNETVIAIPEEDTIYVDNDKASIIGTNEYYIFKDGKEVYMELNKEIEI